MREAYRNVYLIELQCKPSDMGTRKDAVYYRGLHLLARQDDIWDPKPENVIVERDRLANALGRRSSQAKEHLERQYPQGSRLYIINDGRHVKYLGDIGTDGREQLQVSMVRVTAEVPEGPAPIEVKKAWRGLDLIGVISGDEFVFSRLHGCRVLARRAPESAKWFARRFAGYPIMVFRREEVEVIDQMTI